MPKCVRSNGAVCFCTLLSLQILAENPSLPVTEVSKIAGARWKELPAEQRVAYEDMWRADKERCDCGGGAAAAASSCLSH